MPQITQGNLTTILDKLARWACETIGDTTFNPSFNAGMQVANGDIMSGSNDLATFLLGLDDEDVEADLLPAARILDEQNPVPPVNFLLGISSVNAMITALNTHLKGYGFAGLDAYLTSLNGSNGINAVLRAHGFFRKYLATLSPQNVFIPVDTVLATFSETGAAAGTYANVASIDKTQYAGAKLRIKNVTALTTSAVVTVTATKVDGTSASLTATLSTHTINTETDLSDTAAIYVAVTGISMASGGTSADEFEVIAKADRSVTSA